MSRKVPHADSLTMPQEGINILEASAGTGKTYAIQNLFARMIVEKGLPVDSLLVVTYTEAATKELKERIRGILCDISVYIATGECGEDRIRELAKPPEDDLFGRVDVRRRVELALRDFDEAAIYTIHGFCARMLRDNAFENAMLFDAELAKDQTAIIRDIAEDFYRRRFYETDDFEFSIIEHSDITVGKLFNFLKAFPEKPHLNLNPPANPSVYIEQVKNTFDTLLSEWQLRRDEILNKITESNVSRAEKHYRDDIVKKHSVMLDSMCKGEFIPAHFSAVEKFSNEALNAAISDTNRKRGQSAPNDPLFDLCDSLLEALDAYRLTVYFDAKSYYEQEYSRRKNELNQYSFSDLLIDLRQSLTQDSPAAERLAGIIREKFSAVMIDEFQDTDPVQYDIFRKIFHNTDKPTFMVGDPKQAIYSFRGADIFTYKKAKDEVSDSVDGTCYTLGKNWRSEKHLTDAVNVLFKCDEQRLPFANNFILYDGQLDAAGKPPEKSLTINGIPDPAPFKLWFKNAEKKINKQQFETEACKATAAEIYRLITAPEVKIAGQPVTPSDIAILVPQHKHAAKLQPYLRDLNIPSVVQSNANVFDSEDAEQLLRLLLALEEPDNAWRIRAALVTDLLGTTAEDIYRFLNPKNDNDRLDYENELLFFVRNHTLWSEKGFIRMFNEVMTETGMRERLLQYPGGERKLTNILHLAELCHQAETERRLGITGLTAWFTRQLDPNARETDGEEYEMRLESDRRAVTIMTIHKSKGLQFPIVFCPFNYAVNSTLHKDAMVYSHHEATNELILDMRPDAAGNNAAAANEKLAENMRLLYVALTRAEHRCYLLWGNINRTDSSAPAFLFHGEARMAKNPEDSILTAMNNKLSSGVDEPEITGLVNTAGNTIELIRSLPILPDSGYYNSMQWQDAEFRPLIFRGRIERDWQFTSYSGFSPHATGKNIHAEDIYDYDAVEEEIPLTRTARDELDIFNFPAGVKTGNCWHKIFEDIDFTAEPTVLRKHIDEKLERFGLTGEDKDYKEKCRRIVMTMVGNVLSAPLIDGLRLEMLAKSDTLRELTFDYPLNPRGVGSAQIRELLAGYAEKYDKPLYCPPALDSWERVISGGFMNGSIDLVFRHDGKFYIADWKSNMLDGFADSFTPTRLEEEMIMHHYYLQYLFYTVALHKYLRRTLKDYDYERHFGGIFYIFLRGVDPQHPGRGIFSDIKPHRHLIEQLTAILAGEVNG